MSPTARWPVDLRVIRHRGLTPAHKLVAIWLWAHPEDDRAEIAAGLNFTPEAVADALEQLAAAGIKLPGPHARRGAKT
jgi:DNA-binding MarR family transcriptional regulator